MALAVNNAARDALERELFANLLHICLVHIDEPAAVGLYFQAYLFGGRAADR